MTKFPWNYYCYVGWWWFSCSAATVMAASVVWRRRRMVMSGTCFRGWVTDYASQLTDIKSNNPKAYYNFCRMCPDDYDELLHLSLRRIQTVERHLSWRANIHERSTTAKTRDKLYFKLLSTCRLAVSFDVSKEIDHGATCRRNRRQRGRYFNEVSCPSWPKRNPPWQVRLPMSTGVYKKLWFCYEQ